MISHVTINTNVRSPTSTHINLDVHKYLSRRPVKMLETANHENLSTFNYERKNSDSSFSAVFSRETMDKMELTNHDER